MIMMRRRTRSDLRNSVDFEICCGLSSVLGFFLPACCRNRVCIRGPLVVEIVFAFVDAS
jgi:hypothetical protein